MEDKWKDIDAIWGTLENRKSQLERKGNERLHYCINLCIYLIIHNVCTWYRSVWKITRNGKSQRTTHYHVNLWYLYTWKIMSIINPLAIRLHCRHKLDVKYLMASRSCLASSCLSSFGGAGDGAHLYDCPYCMCMVQVSMEDEWTVM